jgi:hypothetical protein
VNEYVRGAVFDASCRPELARWLSANVRDVVGYFVPTDAQIRGLEVRLRHALEAALSVPDGLYDFPSDASERREALWGAEGVLREILQRYPDYRRQYAGAVLRGGARCVLASSFPELRGPEPDEFANWTTQWLADAVDDGGAWFWRIQYDVATGVFSHFDVNASG